MKNIILLFTLIFAYNLKAQDFSPLEHVPVLWLDASDGATITETGGSISSWQDKSGNNNHTNQATVTNQPTFTNTIDGISFDGDDVLIGNNLGYGSDTTITIFIVAEPNTGSDKGSVIAKGQWTSGSDYRIELGENGYDVAVQNAREWNSSSGSWHIDHKNMFYTYYNSNQEVGYYLNGDRIELPRYNVPYNPNNNDFSIGARFNYSDFFSGKIYEVILFQKELNRCETTQIEGYLYHKWGFQSYIISNHPYKDNSFGICNEIQVSIDENSPNGTVIDTIEGTYVNTPVNFSDFRIENEELYSGTFALSAAGELSILNNTNLDYEKISTLSVEVSASANGERIYGVIQVNINDISDGDSPKVNSELWGVNGEKWDSRGRLPDFSYVGYKSGEATYNYDTTIVDVTNFGANNTDELSDVAAIRAAIASVTSGVIYFPAGLYVIDDVITIDKSNIVLRGAGNNATSGTKFYFPNSGTDLGISGNLNTGDAGYMIRFNGINTGPGYTILDNTKMGDRSLTLSNVSGIEVGELVNIEYSGTHPVNGELWNHIQNDQNSDWPCSVAWSNGSGGLGMYHTVERIEGNIVTLKEPIRLDINTSWNPQLKRRTDWYINNCGVEDIYMEHLLIPQPDHLDEPGYNTIAFEKSFNCWINNVTILNADNGIFFKQSGFGEMKNITFGGRGGHHGWKFAYSSHCLADNINFINTEKWTHSFTLTHKANGNVVSNLTGVPGIPISTDFHRNTPWETLITNVDNDWNYNSSGVWCAGPNAGKRTVYWNMGGDGFSSYPNWDDYQTTLVGNLSIPEKFHAEKGWHENVPNIEPANLYYSQLNRRMNLPNDPTFTSDAILGERTNYWERDPSRWRIKDNAYQLFFSETPQLTGNRLGEYSIYNTAINGDMVITSNIASLENTIINPSADAALIINYQDDLNYYFASFSATASESGIYKVENGIQTLLKSITATLTNNYSLFSFNNMASTLGVYENGELVDSVLDTTFTNGKVGFGSFDDASSFDDIILELSTVLSVGEFNNLNQKIILYPNPIQNDLFLVSDKKELSTVKIYDMLGKDLTSRTTVSNLNTNKVTVDLSTLKAGIYIIKIKTIANKIYKK